MLERPMSTVRIVACTILAITNGLFLIGYFLVESAIEKIEEEPKLVNDNLSDGTPAADEEWLPRERRGGQSI